MARVIVAYGETNRSTFLWKEYVGQVSDPVVMVRPFAVNVLLKGSSSINMQKQITIGI